MGTLRGKDGFEEYYENLFLSRWETLKDSFHNDPSYIDWNVSKGQSYFLDSGSVLAAYALPLDDAFNILDMCAAPGGKSLVIAHRMPLDAKLLCNERSASRRTRLSNVLENHLQEDIRKRINISANDGSLMCKKETEPFDAILLDAPCSSERHVFLDKKYLDQWSSARIKNLAVSQWSLLSSAYRILRDGGYLLYSTCALSNVENDEVIRKLLKKFDSAKVVPVDFNRIYSECIHSLPSAEETEFGYRVLPDVQKSAGPLFFSLIKKG